MVQNHITLNPWSKQPHVVLAVQGESQAREIIATLIDASGAPINMTGKTARMYIEKTDKTTVFFDGVTKDALNGVVSFTLPLQATTVPGSANKGQIIVNDATGATLVSYGLRLDVVASRFNGILESTSEFTALQEALAMVQDIDNRVPKDTTIAGLGLQKDITLSELIAAGLAAGGTGGAALNALALGGVAAARIIKNKNYLLNWWFPNPVNQRGVSGTISTPGYFIDMWRLVSGTVTLTANGLTLNGTIAQILEFAVSDAVTSTVSMHSGTATASYNKASKTFTITSSGGTIRAANLGFGAVPPTSDNPADFGEQLALCQRYCMRVTRDLRMTYYSPDAFVFYIPTSTPLRINPVLESGSLAVKTLGSTIVPGFTLTTVRYNSGSIFIRMTKSNHGMTDAFLYCEDAVFSADV